VPLTWFFALLAGPGRVTRTRPSVSPGGAGLFISPARAGALGGTQRTQLNAPIAQEAGLPSIRAVVEAVEGAGWLPDPTGVGLVIRSTFSRVRLADDIVSSFALHLLAGAEVGRGEVGPMSPKEVLELAAQAEGSPVPDV